MTEWFPVLLAVTLVLAAAAGAAPFLCIADIRRTRAQKRSLYEKSALQIAPAAGVLSVFLGAALGADIVIGGSIASRCVSSAVLIGLLAISAGALFLLGSAMLFAGNFKKYPLFYCAAFAGLAGILFLGMLTALLLRGAVPADLKAIFAEWQFMGLWTFFAFLLAFFAAEVLAMFRYVTRRGKDDYGRDYYSTMMRIRAKGASLFGAMTLIPAIVLAFFVPPFIGMASAAAPYAFFAPEGFGSVRMCIQAAALCLPLAAAICLLPARAKNPMSMSSAAVCAPFFLIAGVVSIVLLII